MRGRTNYTGGAKPVINGEIKKYEIAQGSTINKGDFVELSWRHALSPLAGYRSSSVRYIKLSGGTHIVAVRASSGYQWTLYAIDFVDRVPVIRSMFNPTVGSGSIESSKDLQLVALEDDRFAYSGVRSDSYLGVAVILMKYEAQTITYLSKHYYYDKNKSSSNPTYSPIAKCSGKRLVSTWGNYFMITSYDGDVLTVLTEEVISPTGGSVTNHFFYPIPGQQDKFLCGKNHEDTASGEETFYLMELKSDNAIATLAHVKNEYGGSKPMPHNFAFVTDKYAISVTGYYNGTSYGQYSSNRFRVYTCTSSTIARTSETYTEKLAGMPSSREVLSGGGAVSSLGNGYFVMLEGANKDNGTIYLTLGYISNTGGVEIKDVIEIKASGFYGGGFILVDKDGECYYIEDNHKKSDTSYMRFKVVNNGHIELEQDKVFIKEYMKRAEGFANQSGTGGDTIEIYVPKAK